MIDPSGHFFSNLKSEVSKLLYLGLPVIAAQIFMTLMSVVDTLMAGHYDATHLAAVGIGISLFGPIIILGGGTLMALNPIVAQDIGGRKLNAVGEKVRQALWLALIMALPAFFLLRMIDPLMELMNIDESMRIITDGFLRGISWGVFPVYLFVALRHFNEGLGATGPAMYISVIGFLFNIPANFVLIYGYLGFPEMGGVGVGWASTVAYFSMFCGMLLYTVWKPSYQRFAIFKTLSLPSRKYLGEIFKVGFPIGISRAMDRGIFALIALLMGSISSVAMAGHQIAFNFSSLLIMLPFGLATAITFRVGFNLGRKRTYEGRFAGLTGVGLCLGFLVIVLFLIFAAAPFIASLYTKDEEVLSLAISLLYFVAFYQLSEGLQVSAYGALRGLKDTRIPMYVNLATYWGVGLPIGYLLSFIFGMGPQGMWIGLTLGIAIAGFIHLVRFYRNCCGEKYNGEVAYPQEF